MEHIHTFGAQHNDTESSAFTVPGRLAEHLEQYARIAEETRNKMTPVMKAIMALTDKAALRAAEVQKTNK